MVRWCCLPGLGPSVQSRPTVGFISQSLFCLFFSVKLKAQHKPAVTSNSSAQTLQISLCLVACAVGALCGPRVVWVAEV